jgi:hypothetical protein
VDCRVFVGTWSKRVVTHNRLRYLWLFQALHVAEQIMNLIRVELEHRHGWVTGLYPFRQSFAKGFHRVAQMQGSEWRRDLQWALRHPVDGMASRTIVQGEGLAALLGRRRGHRWTHHEKSKSNMVQMNLHFLDHFRG